MYGNISDRFISGIQRRNGERGEGFLGRISTADRSPTCQPAVRLASINFRYVVRQQSDRSIEPAVTKSINSCEFYEIARFSTALMTRFLDECDSEIRSVRSKFKPHLNLSFARLNRKIESKTTSRYFVYLLLVVKILMFDAIVSYNTHTHMHDNVPFIYALL